MREATTPAIRRRPLAATLLAAFRVQAVTLGAAGVFGFASIAPGRVLPFLTCLGVAVVLSFTGTLLWARWRRRRGSPARTSSDRFRPGSCRFPATTRRL